MKKRKALIIVFFMGLLLMGIGCGISFAEFSTFVYGGEKNLNGERTTVVLQKTLPENIKTLILHVRRYDLSNIRVESDASLADHQISVEILCSKELITPYLEEPEEPEETEDGEDDSMVYSLDYTAHYADDELSTFFQVKDILLDGLKNRMIYSYNADYVQEVVVKAPPELAGNIIFE